MKHPNPDIETVLARLAAPALATIDLSLDRITKLLKALGNPHDRLPPVLHVAGTNGKGSLVAYLTSMLQAAGYRVHRYISPHLVRFNERIVVANNEINDSYLLELLYRVDAIANAYPVTFFEATTAAAFLAFSEGDADIVLLETGLGGRLDATNMVRSPLLVALTPISMDHMEYLGKTLTAIAKEKTGIMKQGIGCVCGPQSPEAKAVIEDAASSLHSPLYRFDKDWHVHREGDGFRYHSSSWNSLFPSPCLSGEHQMANAGTAIACLEHLKGFTITEEHIALGLANAVWPARLQRLREGNLAALLPKGSELWLDGGHNPGAGEVIGEWVRMQKKPVHVICGMLKNKDTIHFLQPLAPYIQSLSAVAIEDEPLSQNPEVIKSAATAAGIREINANSRISIKNAIESIVNEQKNDFIILICGSLYLAGNILWQNNQFR